MDQSFFIRAQRLLGESGGESLSTRVEHVPVDHALLAAMVAAQQAMSATARAQEKLAGPSTGDNADPVALLVGLLGHDRSSRRSDIVSGCFNRATAARGLNIR